MDVTLAALLTVGGESRNFGFCVVQFYVNTVAADAIFVESSRMTWPVVHRWSAVSPSARRDGKVGLRANSCDRRRGQTCDAFVAGAGKGRSRSSGGDTMAKWR